MIPFTGQIPLTGLRFAASSSAFTVREDQSLCNTEEERPGPPGSRRGPRAREPGTRRAQGIPGRKGGGAGRGRSRHPAVPRATGQALPGSPEQPGDRGLPLRDCRHLTGGTMDIAVLQFPGSNCDQDAFQLFAGGLKLPTRFVWHKDTRLGEADLVVLPGGFAYGDYLRCGAIARFSPVMGAVREYARKGGLVLGICNGFQILCEAGLLPGALIRNSSLEYRCMTRELAVEDAG